MKYTGLSTQKNHMMCCCCCQAVCMSTVYFSYALCTRQKFVTQAGVVHRIPAIFILEDKASSH